MVSLTSRRNYNDFLVNAGPIVQIGPSSLSFASPHALRTIYHSGRTQNPLRKSDYYKTVDAPSGAYSTHTETDFNKHAFRRRILDSAFSDASMRSAEDFMIQNIDTFCDVLGSRKDDKESWSEPRDMSKFCTYFAYDVMGDLVFGKRLLLVAVLGVTPAAAVHCSASNLFTSTYEHNGGQIAQAEHAFVADASSCVKDRIENERKSDKSQRKDMMHYILNAKAPESGRPFTDQDLDAESSLLIAAGADTTSSTLAAAFFYLTLASSRRILSHLQQELRNEFDEVSCIVWSAVKNNMYLRAVVEETLRMAPAAPPSELPCTVLQQPGLQIAGQFIPAGITVGCSAYVMHHDETAYPESFSFRPERWIPHTTTADSEEAGSTRTHLQSISPLQDPQQVRQAGEAFCAFSLGSRGCVGKTMAYMELCLALSRILRMFDIRRADDKLQKSVRSKDYARKHGLEWRDNEYQLKDVFTTDRAGEVIHFKRHDDTRTSVSS